MSPLQKALFATLPEVARIILPGQERKFASIREIRGPFFNSLRQTSGGILIDQENSQN